MLLRLPLELIVRVFCYLDLIDLLRAKQVHPSLKTSIKSLPVLQYSVETQSAYVEDNQYCGLPTSERLRLLKNRQEAWSKCSIDFRRTIPVLHEPSGIYDLMGGVYLLGDANHRTIHYFMLPSSDEDEVKWEKIDISKPLVDMGLNIHEHDLIAVITKSTHPTDTSKKVLEIELLQFSTGAPHPHARIPVLLLCELTDERLAVSIEIVGLHLAVITNRYFSAGPTEGDYLYVFDWTTGEQKMSVELPQNTYSGLLFLSPDLILLPNIHASALDIWRIPTSEAQSAASSTTESQAESPAPRPLLSLIMPTLTRMYALLDLACRAEPSPTAPSSGLVTRTESTSSFHPPFRSTSANALLTFTMRIHDLMAGNIIAWSMHVRRGDLLAICEQVLQMVDEKAAVEREVEMSPTGEEEEIFIKWSLGALAGEAENECEELQEQTSGLWIPEHEDGSEDREILFSYLPEVTRLPKATHPPVPYSTWGAPITHWVLSADAPTRWIKTSAGTRCLSFISSSAVGNTRRPWALQVLDFNPYTVRRAALRDAANQSSHFQAGYHTPLDTREPSSERESTSDNSEMGALGRLAALAQATAKSVFSEPVGTTLQCTSTFAVGAGGEDDSRDWDFQGVLMDDERLVGLRTSPSTGQISEIVVMHIGLGA
ncbi:hypothetical protein H0H81_009800 [Sphagnurus paluster]|uniref:F-box domain-containing protein n=1 Tax=Sphagnurus paluster TaxID=117069 RepID=A0A9P7G140_9AGAR|nr:hypothetical protein H0H81_009800 [Sphagnurus paluster]